MPFKDIDKLKYDDAQGNEVHLDGLRISALHLQTLPVPLHDREHDFIWRWCEIIQCPSI
jgi:hypothetical protein